ncbi:hypothetical protein AKJ61_00765 [candidate division MSBL1 archaeon SCGC-AAA259B11]|uniref:Uncharacterized protein n=1 Tax=candidate division MSBL1 archaeon SCGC-AAA259B11 TaxID=1698260 RepID=A0A133U837_9EURY|nr:hypothetical protein AKJ61_00765 [candidate division MSBL1 archaeon SCGC-AAA259B11]
MEIEKGINPNCSELVVRLTPWDDVAELRALFHELEEVTGWKAGVSEQFVDADEGSFDIVAPVPIEKIRLGEVCDMEGCPHVRLGDIVELNRSKETNERIAEKLKYGVSGVRKILANGFWCGIQEKPIPQRRQPVGLIPNDEVRVETVARGQPPSLLHDAAVRSHDGYEPHPALKAWQHPYEPHFEPLAKVVRSFGTTWHTHDGGSPEPFRKWCRKNGFSDVARKFGP